MHWALKVLPYFEITSCLHPCPARDSYKRPPRFGTLQHNRTLQKRSLADPSEILPDPAFWRQGCHAGYRCEPCWSGPSIQNFIPWCRQVGPQLCALPRLLAAKQATGATNIPLLARNTHIPPRSCLRINGFFQSLHNSEHATKQFVGAYRASPLKTQTTYAGPKLYRLTRNFPAAFGPATFDFAQISHRGIGKVKRTWSTPMLGDCLITCLQFLKGRRRVLRHHMTFPAVRNY